MMMAMLLMVWKGGCCCLAPQLLLHPQLWEQVLWALAPPLLLTQLALLTLVHHWC